LVVWTAGKIKRSCSSETTGLGFDMRYADMLFRAFQRLHFAEEFEGAGIKPATVQRIIHRHEGEIRVEGAVDQCAGFYFSLPRARIQERGNTL
jgi:light-regulated signal transduction histidine kinase (bacteriophytochrome)